MMEATAHHEAKAGSDTTFGVFFALVFLIIAGLPQLAGDPVRIWALGVSGVFLLLILLRPSFLAPFNYLWFKLGLILGAVIAPLVMGLVFFLVLLPTGLIMRMRGKDLLALKMDREASSYWNRRDINQTSMRDQF